MDSANYCTTDDVGYILVGAALSASTIPTITEGCNMIKSAEKIINGYLHKSSSYTTIPTPITSIAIQLVINMVNYKYAWVDAEGATAVSDPMGSSTYPQYDADKILTPEIKKQLDDFIKNEDYYLSAEPAVVFGNVQNTDLDFSDSMYQ